MSLQMLSRQFSIGILFVFLLGILSSCGSQKTIVNGLDEKEANEIIVYLSTKGVDASKIQSAGGGAGGGAKVIMWDIQVPEEQVTEAMSLLNQAGLPRRRGQSLLGIFTGGGLVPSELQERIRYQAGLAEQIASTIRKIDGVLDAEVQISFPEENPLKPGEKTGSITASVYVKHTGVLDDPNIQLASKVKRLVAASVTGLDYDNVTIIGDRARYSSLPTTIEHAGAEESKQYVSVWTIILAKDSALRFRIVFFSFLLLILVLLITLGWIIWKVYPILRKVGGTKALFHLHPLELEVPAKEVAKEEVKKEEEKPKVEAETTDKDVDVT